MPTYYDLMTTYFNELATVARQGDAREESFYPKLAEMLEKLPKRPGETTYA